MERQGEFAKFAVSDNDYLPRYAREGDGSNIHKLKYQREEPPNQFFFPLLALPLIIVSRQRQAAVGRLPGVTHRI